MHDAHNSKNEKVYPLKSSFSPGKYKKLLEKTLEKVLMLYIMGAVTIKYKSTCRLQRRFQRK